MDTQEINPVHSILTYIIYLALHFGFLIN